MDRLQGWLKRPASGLLARQAHLVLSKVGHAFRLAG